MCKTYKMIREKYFVPVLDEQHFSTSQNCFEFYAV